MACMVITGAAGSGTSTLGRELACRLGHAHFESDDFYWLPSDPPYQVRRAESDRQRLLRQATEGCCDWVLSGSICGWGDFLTPRLHLAVFLWVPAGIRIARLIRREQDRYGHLIQPGGPMHAHHCDFISWSACYDHAGPDARSWTRHNAWLAGLPCPVLRVEGDTSVSYRVRTVLERLSVCVPGEPVGR